MLKKIVLFTVIFFFIAIVPIHALTSSNAENLNEQVDDALQLAEMKRYEESLNRLEGFMDLSLATTSSQGHNLFVDELSIVSKVYEEAVETLKADNRLHEDKVQSVMKLRLVTDAVQTEHQPLWTEMEDRMMMALDESLLSILENDRMQFHHSLDHFLKEYDLIYESLKVDLGADTLQKLDDQIRYIDQYRTDVFEKEEGETELAMLKSDLQAIFDNWKEDEADPSLWWVIISTGSLIVISLAYTGWRKFIGMKESQKAKNKMKN